MNQPPEALGCRADRSLRLEQNNNHPTAQRPRPWTATSSSVSATRTNPTATSWFRRWKRWPPSGTGVWFDQKFIDIGDRFHPEIQRALAESKVGILLVSSHFLTSDYITRHELPFLLRQAERGALKLGILHVSACGARRLGDSGRDRREIPHRQPG
ncbi:MAG: toll/interleukin-1 receptor domain-containing protein [Candidatus Competibacteraceae bacterium]|nr:toll/interleukin-1 receptor domain-containing protein [Candidatus Competibacteraceae bacterium]